MKIDVERLIQCTNVRHIVESLGIPINNCFIPCPDHFERLGRFEKKQTHCAITEFGYYCHSCHGSGNIITLVQKTQEVSFFQAVKIIIDIMGLNLSDFILDDDNLNNIETGEIFPLSHTDLELLGLKATVSCKSPCGWIYNKNDSIPQNTRLSNKPDFYLTKNKKGQTVIENLYVIEKYTNYKLIDLWKEDIDCFNEIIKGKITEALVDNIAVIDSNILYCLFNPNRAYFIAEELKKNVAELNNLALRFGVQPLTYNQVETKRKSRFIV